MIAARPTSAHEPAPRAPPARLQDLRRRHPLCLPARRERRDRPQRERQVEHGGCGSLGAGRAVEPARCERAAPTTSSSPGASSDGPRGWPRSILTLDNEDGWLPIEFAEVTHRQALVPLRRERVPDQRSPRSSARHRGAAGRRQPGRELARRGGPGDRGCRPLAAPGGATPAVRGGGRRQEPPGPQERGSLPPWPGRREPDPGRPTCSASCDPQVRRLALQARHQQEHDALRARGRVLVRQSRTADARRMLREALGDARRRAAAAEAAAEGVPGRADGRPGGARGGGEPLLGGRDGGARGAAEARERDARGPDPAGEPSRRPAGARVAELEATAGQADADLADSEAAARQAPGRARDEPETGPMLDAAARTRRACWQATLAQLAAADRELVAAEEELAEARRRDADLIAREARAGGGLGSGAGPWRSGSEQERASDLAEVDGAPRGASSRWRQAAEAARDDGASGPAGRTRRARGWTRPSSRRRGAARGDRAPPSASPPRRPSSTPSTSAPTLGGAPGPRCWPPPAGHPCSTPWPPRWRPGRPSRRWSAARWETRCCGATPARPMRRRDARGTARLLDGRGPPSERRANRAALAAVGGAADAGGMDRLAGRARRSSRGWRWRPTSRRCSAAGDRCLRAGAR